MDGRTMRCGIISSCQSAATSETVKRSWACVHRGAALYQVPDLYVSLKTALLWPQVVQYMNIQQRTANLYTASCSTKWLVFPLTLSSPLHPFYFQSQRHWDSQVGESSKEVRIMASHSFEAIAIATQVINNMYNRQSTEVADKQISRHFFRSYSRLLWALQK